MRSAAYATVLGAVALATIACAGAGSVPRPDAAMAGSSRTDLATLERGRTVYVTSCTGCHQLHRTDAYDQRGWRQAVADMAPKAKLDAKQQEDLLAYLLAAAR